MANQKTDTQVRKEAAERILLALAGDKKVAAPDYTDRDKDIFLDRILDAIPSKQKQIPVANTGFGYDDVLVPNRPHSPFLNDGYYPETNTPAEEILAPVAESEPVANNTPAARAATAGFVPETQPSVGVSYAGGLNYNPIDENGMLQSRRRRTPIEQALAAAKDSFDYISGLDNKAYLGKTMELLNKYDKTRMEEDPEGYQIDLNRAKLLSHKAAEETDPVKKAVLGREIKKLLPVETQGLSDEAAADFFTSSLDEKVKLEMVKGYNKLQQIEAQNKGRIDLQTAKSMSAKELEDAKAQYRNDLEVLKQEYQNARAEGNNERMLTLADKITDRQISLKNIDYQIKEMQQKNANERNAATNEANIQKAYISANARVDAAKLSANKGAMSDEMARAAWPQIKASFERNQADIQNVLDKLSEREVFGPIVGRQLELGFGDPEDRELLGWVRGELSRLVQQRLQQVREASGTARAADTEKEAERVIGYLGSPSTIDQQVLVGAIKQFMEASERAMRDKEEYLFGPQSRNTLNVQKSKPLEVGEERVVNGHKIVRRS